MSSGHCHLAVEPAAFIRDPSLFVEKIKSERGVFLRRIDKRWASRVHAALTADGKHGDFDKKRIGERARKLQDEHGVKPVAGASEVAKLVDHAQWIDAARLEHAKEPCTFIVVESQDATSENDPIVSRTAFEDLEVDPSLKVKPTPEGLSGLLGPLLAKASWIVIEDPYIGSPGALKVLGKIMEAATKVPEKIVLTSEKNGIASHLLGEMSKHVGANDLPKLVVAEAATNHSPGPHLRQILTDRGGFVLDRGLDEFHARGFTEDIQIPARLPAATCVAKRKALLPRKPKSTFLNQLDWTFVHSDRDFAP